MRGAGPRPVWGTLNPATARTLSGKNSDVFQTMGAPQSWPIRIASFSPSPSMRPTISVHFLDRIGLDRLGLVASAISAHVDRGHPIARCRNRWNLVAPGVPALRPAMHQHDERSFSGLRDPQPNAVGVNERKLGFLRSLTSP